MCINSSYLVVLISVRRNRYGTEGKLQGCGLGGHKWWRSTVSTIRGFSGHAYNVNGFYVIGHVAQRAWPTILNLPVGAAKLDNSDWPVIRQVPGLLT